MKNKKILWIVIILLVCITVVSVIFIINSNNKNNYKIPDGYIAIFHGGSGERTYETYIYKENNGYANSGFYYINVTSTTTSWGSGEWISKITKRGSVQWTDGVFSVAKENGAYSYVTLPGSNQSYSIEQFMSMFLMN